MLLLVLSIGLPLDAAPPDTRSFLADLPADRLAELALDEVRKLTPAEQLAAVFGAGPPYEFKSGAVVVYTDARWFSTSPSDAPGAPFLELRRWPGDTVLAFYALTGPLRTAEEGPPIADGDFELLEGSSDAWGEWNGWLRTDRGDLPVRWVEQSIEDAPAYLGALLMPGDGGLGTAGIEDLTLELLGVFSRIRLTPQSWRVKQGIPRGVPIEVALSAGTTGAADEKQAPWQVVQGNGFTMGLPPGFRARRLDGTVPPPVDIPGGLMWLRGRFTDVEGTAVAVGDDRRVGYVALVQPKSKAWSAGSRPPLAAAGASLVSGQAFPLLVDRTGAKAGRAERWQEPGFDGEWLLFRLEFEEQGLEIGLPVLSGRSSPSLFWIAATWRGPNQAPAEPPVDPNERFGIRFERLTRADRSRQPWMEGYLAVPGMRVELPKGWVPAASLRTTDGYPVRLVDSTGAAQGVVTRLEADELPVVDEADGGWVAQSRPGFHRASGVYLRGDLTYVFLAKEGHAFLFERRLGDEASWERMAASVQLMRTKQP